MYWNDQKLIETLQGGGVAVMPTDTLYGVVGKTENASTVERIYELRKRASQKPCIILIGDINDLKRFGITLTSEQEKEIEKFKEPTSFILDCEEEKFSYLHRGIKTLAFRIPHIKELRDLLLKTGPLIAPSANTEAMPPAKNITEAKNYFGDLVDLYIDGGEIAGKSSRIIKLHKDGSIEILRK